MGKYRAQRFDHDEEAAAPQLSSKACNLLGIVQDLLRLWQIKRNARNRLLPYVIRYRTSINRTRFCCQLRYGKEDGSSTERILWGVRVREKGIKVLQIQNMTFAKGRNYESNSIIEKSSVMTSKVVPPIKLPRRNQPVGGNGAT